MVKYIKIVIFVFVSLATLGGVYYWQVTLPAKKALEEAESKKIIKLNVDQINYIEVKNKNQTIIVMKGAQGWSLQEPVVDKADDAYILQLLENLSKESVLAVAKQGADIKWSEFGLDQNVLSLLFKNNLGNSQKLIVSEMKNFEGLHYARMDNDDRILLIHAKWPEQILQKSVYYREKKLYRGAVAGLRTIQFKSLSDQFTLNYQEGQWYSKEKPEYVLDQDLVHNLIKDISESTIQDYLVEGEPSLAELKSKGLIGQKNLEVQFFTVQDSWKVSLQLSEEDKAIYALTEKPTFLIKLDVSRWQLFGNVTLDGLRDRKSIMRFDLGKVKQFFYKVDSVKAQLTQQQEKWNFATDSELKKDYIEQDKVKKVINDIHNLQISYFLDDKMANQFVGNNMVIFKSSSDQLLFQFNWGPLIKLNLNGQEKEVYLARTHLSDMVFAIEKSDIDNFEFEKFYEKK